MVFKAQHQQNRKRAAWLLLSSLLISGCGSDASTSQDSSVDPILEDQLSAAEFDSAGENSEPLELGSISLNLPSAEGSGKALCNLSLTRIPEANLANVILTLDIVGAGCDGMGSCTNPNMGY